MNKVLIVERLCKTFPRVWHKPAVEAVKDASFEIDQGEAFGFIGPNGAGKSTTIKVLTGGLRATSGRVLINGRDSEDFKARIGLAYVPENPYLSDYLTPFEVLQMGVRVHGRRFENEKAHCMKWLERFGLCDVAYRLIRTFSKGMTQRTALAHALAIQPSFLVLDEPLSGLDPIGRRDVVDILSEFRQQGGTLFFSSHVLHDVERLADRFGLIHQGQLKTVQSPSELVGGEARVTVRVIGKGMPGMVAEAGGRWCVEAASSELWEVLHKLESSGHVLIEVKPALSLEGAFLRFVK
jgi:ABC-2 type transport system ATP-binding protein